MLKKEKILLTGKNGFLGRIIFDFLTRSEYEVESLGRSDDNTYRIDLNLSENIKLNQQYDTIVHAAGKAHTVPRTKEEEEEFYNVNYHGTLRLLKALENNPPKHFVFISTIAVYGLDEGELILETAPLNATEPYGKSKVLAEKAVIEWCEQRNCIYSILRLPLVAGAQPPGNLGAMIKGIKSRKYFRIGNGKAKKSIVLAEDVAQIIPTVSTIGGIYNLTDSIHPSFQQIEDTLAKRFGVKIISLPAILAKLIGYFGDTINFILGKRKFPLDSRAYRKITRSLTLDDTKAQQQLQWKPKSVLDFLRNNINL